MTFRLIDSNSRKLQVRLQRALHGRHPSTPRPALQSTPPLPSLQPCLSVAHLTQQRTTLHATLHRTQTRTRISLNVGHPQKPPPWPQHQPRSIKCELTNFAKVLATL